MLITIPYQLLETNNVSLDNFKTDHKGRYIAPLRYISPTFQFQDISILTCPMTISDYDQVSNRIRFDIRNQTSFLNKINQLQESIVRKFYVKRFDILKFDISLEEIKAMFQFLFYGITLTLFIFPNTNVLMPAASGAGASAAPFQASQLKKGDQIRCVIRIHGISMLPVRTGEFFPRFRIQHSVPVIYRVMQATPTAVYAKTSATSAIPKEK